MFRQELALGRRAGQIDDRRLGALPPNHQAEHAVDIAAQQEVVVVLRLHQPRLLDHLPVDQKRAGLKRRDRLRQRIDPGEAAEIIAELRFLDAAEQATALPGREVLADQRRCPATHRIGHPVHHRHPQLLVERGIVDEPGQPCRVLCGDHMHTLSIKDSGDAGVVPTSFRINPKNRNKSHSFLVHLHHADRTDLCIIRSTNGPWRQTDWRWGTCRGPALTGRKLACDAEYGEPPGECARF